MGVSFGERALLAGEANGPKWRWALDHTGSTLPLKMGGRYLSIPSCHKPSYTFVPSPLVKHGHPKGRHESNHQSTECALTSVSKYERPLRCRLEPRPNESHVNLIIVLCT